MADKAKAHTGASTPKKGITQKEAVRRALAHFGSDALPLQMQPWIKQRFGIDLSNNHISTYKGEIRNEAGKGKVPAPAPKAAAAAAPAAEKPAAPAAKKPAAAKPTSKKPPAAKPQVQHAVARSNASPKGSGAAGSISLGDIETVKGLIGRVGAEQLRSLIDLLAR
jgi:hypothetical protein